MAKSSCFPHHNKIKALIHEGNVRRVVVEHDGRTIAEFPLIPAWLARCSLRSWRRFAAVVALFKDCTIHVERVSSDAPGSGQSSASAAGSARAV